jgi:hypothetical protein
MERSLPLVNNAMKRLRSLLMLIVALALVEAANAGLTLTLTPAVQNAAPGTELSFIGTLTNTSATDKVFLNDIALSFSGAELVLQPNTFFANVPGILLPGESYNGLLFSVTLSSSAATGDYAATITIKGGANILATGDLVSSALTVLSPTVSIITSNANASEVGPTNGLFTVSRTGGTGTSLTVSYSISGTAVNGTSYNSLSGSITIPSGSASATIPVSPIPNLIAEGDRTVILALSASRSYVTGTSSSATVTIHDKPADNWRFVIFGSNANDPAAADIADWDKDGITNLMEYALNLNPKAADLNGQPAPVVANDYLTLSFTPNPAATDVIFVVEGSTALTSWNTSSVEETTPVQLGSRTFRFKNKVSVTDRAFLRLRVTRAPDVSN